MGPEIYMSKNVYTGWGVTLYSVTDSGVSLYSSGAQSIVEALKDSLRTDTQ